MPTLVSGKRFQHWEMTWMFKPSLGVEALTGSCNYEALTPTAPSCLGVFPNLLRVVPLASAPFQSHVFHGSQLWWPTLRSSFFSDNLCVHRFIEGDKTNAFHQDYPRFNSLLPSMQQKVLTKDLYWIINHQYAPVKTKVPKGKHVHPQLKPYR